MHRPPLRDRHLVLVTVFVVALLTLALRESVMAAPGEPRAATTSALLARQDDSTRVHRELRDAIQRLRAGPGRGNGSSDQDTKEGRTGPGEGRSNW